jgi:hypothetical protein
MVTLLWGQEQATSLVATYNFNQRICRKKGQRNVWHAFVFRVTALHRTPSTAVLQKESGDEARILATLNNYCISRRYKDTAQLCCAQARLYLHHHYWVNGVIFSFHATFCCSHFSLPPSLSHSSLPTLHFLFHLVAIKPGAGKIVPSRSSAG